MLAHCVFLHFSDEHGPEARQSILAELTGLVDKIDGMEAVLHGPNRDYEMKTPDHKDGFIVIFRDREAHLRYERHPLHVAIGRRLVEMCVGGAEGILVYDIEFSGGWGS